VVYVSCDPATLARDLQVFRAEGYSIERAVALDLFPQTSHVETVVALRRARPSRGSST
jgi:23S rRNA (uracil1939-C5)-methyltransferase